MEVNGHSLAGVTHEQAIDIFKSCGDTLHLMLRKRLHAYVNVGPDGLPEPAPANAKPHGYVNLPEPGAAPPPIAARQEQQYVNVPAEPSTAPALPKAKAAPRPPSDAPPSRPNAQDKPMPVPAAAHPYIRHVNRKVKKNK